MPGRSGLSGKPWPCPAQHGGAKQSRPEQESGRAREFEPESILCGLPCERQHEAKQGRDQHDCEHRACFAEVGEEKVAFFAATVLRRGRRRVHAGLRGLCAGRCRCGVEQCVLEAEEHGDVLIAMALRNQLLVLGERGLDYRQFDAEAARHVAADAQVFLVQSHAEPGGEGIADDVRRAIHEIPARAGALAERLDQLRQRQTLRPGECHGLCHRLDDAGAHDLVGGLGGLAGTGRPEVRDRAAHRLQCGLRPGKSRIGSPRHDRERAVARTFDAAAHGRIEEFAAVRGEPARGFTRGVRAHGRAVDDQRAGA